MRIAQIATVGTPVRREGSDSIESLVWLVTRELTRMGHEVTVFGTAGSEVEGELVATLPGPYGTDGSPDDWQLCEWINLCRAVAESERFDVLHSHAYLWGMPLEALARAPMLHTLHVSPYDDQVRLRKLHPSACVTAISAAQWSAFPELSPATVIHHGVDPAAFTFRREPDDYLCYLGRFIPGKGPLGAIKVARTLGVRLLLAGPRNDYFRDQVQPLVDGLLVQYVGYVRGRERDQLLGGARALLYPIEAPEPFGLVLIEAMMCGTPVAALALGAVPELVEDGVTGFAAADLEGLIALMPQVWRLDRAAVRKRAEERFSAHRMAAQYAELYARIAAEG
jgi:glycosyltransferase involved in cell wall biosynthesis